MVHQPTHESGFRFKEELEPKLRDYLFPNDLQQLLIHLQRHLSGARKDLLKARRELQATYDAGAVPTYVDGHPASTTDWKVAPIPADLLDRRVEITGPVNSVKMVINMLSPNAEGEVANMAMLDFEDSMKPTWANAIAGIQNVIGAAKMDLQYVQRTGNTEKVYALDPKNMAHPMVRVRGLHLLETGVHVDGEPVAASIFDLATCAYHTAKIFIAQGKTPKFYVPKCESYQEARWWNGLFQKVEEYMGLKQGALRVTFLIETLPAAFQMEEILYEIRERACGLNGGRWDKIFSDIKVLRNHKDRVMANRSFIDMTKPWMDNYVKRLVKICHKHGAFAMGGMSAFTPGKEAETRRAQTEKVTADKAREASIGHDGCWVSHPYFIGIARAQFKKQNQLDVLQTDFPMRPDLLPQPIGPKTLDGLRTNLRVGIAYQQGWDQGLGCIAFENLMEDLATLEISRAQTWQWLHHQVVLDDGTKVTRELVEQILDEECAKILSSVADEIGDLDEYKKICTSYLRAKEEIRPVFLETELSDFYTTYGQLTQGGKDAIKREGTRSQVEI